MVQLKPSNLTDYTFFPLLTAPKARVQAPVAYKIEQPLSFVYTTVKPTAAALTVAAPVTIGSLTGGEEHYQHVSIYFYDHSILFLNYSYHLFPDNRELTCENLVLLLIFQLRIVTQTRGAKM